MTIYQHFRAYEHPFVDRVLSWKQQVERTFTPYVTDFLDPRERYIVRSIIGEKNEELTFQFFGVHERAERKRAVIAPFYETIDRDDFQIQLLQAKYDRKFNEISHRDVLGALLNLGIDRKKCGDIFVSSGLIQVVVDETIATFVKFELNRIRRASVRFEAVPFKEVLDQEENWQEDIKTVSSLRLDVVMKEIYHLSRNQAARFIASKKVKVNHLQIDDPALQLAEKDLISVQGKGRSKLDKIIGETKKGRIRIKTARLKT